MVALSNGAVEFDLGPICQGQMRNFSEKSLFSSLCDTASANSMLFSESASQSAITSYLCKKP